MSDEDRAAAAAVLESMIDQVDPKVWPASEAEVERLRGEIAKLTAQPAES